jgi:hypothetical protein
VEETVMKELIVLISVSLGIGLAFICAGALFAEEKAPAEKEKSIVLQGMLSVTLDKEKKPTAGKLAVCTGNEEATYLITWNETGKKLCNELATREVEVRAVPSKKNGETWLKIEKYFVLLTGKVKALKDEEGKLKDIRFHTDTATSEFRVVLDKISEKLCLKNLGDKYLVKGEYFVKEKEKEGKKEKEKWLRLETFEPVHKFTGVAEVEDDDEGVSRALTLAIYGDRHDVFHSVLLTSTGRTLMKTAAWDSVEVEGVLVKLGKKTWLKIYSFKKAIPPPPSDDGDPGEDEEEPMPPDEEEDPPPPDEED